MIKANNKYININCINVIFWVLSAEITNKGIYVCGYWCKIYNGMRPVPFKTDSFCIQNEHLYMWNDWNF